jgi:hypothetical protein
MNRQHKILVFRDLGSRRIRYVQPSKCTPIFVCQSLTTFQTYHLVSFLRRAQNVAKRSPHHCLYAENPLQFSLQMLHQTLDLAITKGYLQKGTQIKNFDGRP